MKWISLAGISLCLLLTGCPSSGGGSSAPSGAANVIPVSVGASNVCRNVDELCASVPICQPGTSNCQTISDLLVDTGSVGLRVFGSLLSVPLQQEVDVQGHPLGTCAMFADGGATWGPVQVADVALGGGPPVRIPIQVILPTFAGQTAANNPCNQPVDSDPNKTLFNGILGIGVFKQDCGQFCADNATNLYFSCNGSTCTSTAIPVLNQIQNPVWMLPSGNNGVMIAMPNVPANGAPSVTGSLTLGIGTAANNAPPAGITVLPTDPNNGLLSTNYKGNNLQAIIDSGSNGYFFPDASIPPCPGNTDFYCPPNTLNLMATLVGFGGVIFNGPQVAVPFQVANTQSLFQTNNAAFNNLAGPLTAAPPTFDWGLSFFFGRTVLVGIEGQDSPLGKGPYFAF